MRASLISFAILAATTGVAYADLSSTGAALPLLVVNLSLDTPSQVTAADAPAASLSWAEASPVNSSPLHWATDPLTAKDNPAQVTELPPSPAGDVLCLTGVLSVGALQLVRRARHAHLALPAWYCDSGPVQINHSVVFELCSAPLAVCVFDQPLSNPLDGFMAATRRWSCRDHVLSPQFLVPARQTRGPPC